MPDSSSGPLVSVIVPTFDSGPMLLECLDRFNPARGDIELILVDNASTDGSVDKAACRYPGTIVIRNEKNVGYAQACNQGAVAASAEFLLFLNSDAFLEASALDRLIEAAENDPKGAIWQPLIRRVDGSIEFSGDLFTWWGFFLHLQDRPQGTAPRSIFSTKGACLLVRRSTFEALDGFNHRYFAYFEETDLCWRARMSGREVRLIPDASVEHIGGFTTSRVFAPNEVRYLAFRNRIVTIMCNASPGTLVRVLPLQVAGCLVFALAFVVTGRFRSAAAIVAALWWPIRQMTTVRGQRRQAQQRRTVPDTEVLRPALVGRFTLPLIRRHLREQIYRWERGHSISSVAE